VLIEKSVSAQRLCSLKRYACAEAVLIKQLLTRRGYAHLAGTLAQRLCSLKRCACAEAVFVF